MEVLNIAPVKFDGDKMLILDQTQLPGDTVYLEMQTKEDVWDAIYKLKVRGAPAIGVAAGYGLYICVRALQAKDFEDFYKQFLEIKNYLASSRPTAVNLFWALDRMENCLKRFEAQKQEPWEKALNDIKHALFTEAENIRFEDECACRAMGEYGLTLLKPGMEF